MARPSRNQAIRAEPRSVGSARARDPLAREVRLLGALLGQVIAEQEGAAALDLVERVRGLAIALRRRDDPPTASPSTPSSRPWTRRASRCSPTPSAPSSSWPTSPRRRSASAPSGGGTGRPGGRPSEGPSPRPWRASPQPATISTRSRPRSPASGSRPSSRPIPPRPAGGPCCLRCAASTASLDELDDPRLTPAGDAEIRRRLREEITILWRTADLRGERPTPLDEVRSAMVFFDATLFTATPRVYRVLDAALDRLSGPPPAGAAAPDAGRTGTRPPRAPAFLRWGSWIGGDRDGHPYVTAETTLEALRIHADHVLHGYVAAASRLMIDVAARPRTGIVPPAISRRLLADADELPETMRELEERFPREPYRRRLGAVAERLRRTRTHLAGLPGPQAGRYAEPDQLEDELAELSSALVADGLGRVAHGSLQDLRWQVETFGFHLASLEVRQHSAVHRAALAALSGASSEPAREVAPGVTAGEVLATFRAMAVAQRRFGEAACRRYVISFTERAGGRRRRAGPGPARRRPGDPGGRDVRHPPRRAGARRRAALRVGRVAGRRPDDPGRAPGRRPLPRAPARPRRAPGGDARVLRLQQGVGLRRGPLAAVPRPGAARRRRPRGRRGAHDLPRPRRRPGARRRADPSRGAGDARPDRWPGGSSSPSRAR